MSRGSNTRDCFIQSLWSLISSRNHCPKSHLEIKTRACILLNIPNLTMTLESKLNSAQYFQWDNDTGAKVDSTRRPTTLPALHRTLTIHLQLSVWVGIALTQGCVAVYLQDSLHCVFSCDSSDLLHKRGGLFFYTGCILGTFLKQGPTEPLTSGQWWKRNISRSLFWARHKFVDLVNKELVGVKCKVFYTAWTTCQRLLVPNRLVSTVSGWQCQLNST